MTEQEKIAARLANTEKAFFALATVLQSFQPQYVQDSMNLIMEDYFDANTSLGFDARPDFIVDN